MLLTQSIPSLGSVCDRDLLAGTLGFGEPGSFGIAGLGLWLWGPWQGWDPGLWGSWYLWDCRAEILGFGVPCSSGIAELGSWALGTLAALGLPGLDHGCAPVGAFVHDSPRLLDECTWLCWAGVGVLWFHSSRCCWTSDLWAAPGCPVSSGFATAVPLHLWCQDSAQAQSSPWRCLWMAPWAALPRCAGPDMLPHLDTSPSIPQTGRSSPLLHLPWPS